MLFRSENNDMNNNEKKVIAPNLKEILDKIAKEKELSDLEISKLKEQVKESTEFMKLIEKIEIPKDNYVVFTDNEQQLVYENGEFFLVSTVDSTKEKKKKKRLEAKDMYIEYFIRYTLNKISPNKMANIEKEKTKDIEREDKDILNLEDKEEKVNLKVNEEKREEQIKKSLESMVSSVNTDYERTKIIDKIKSGKQNSEKIR